MMSEPRQGELLHLPSSLHLPAPETPSGRSTRPWRLRGDRANVRTRTFSSFALAAEAAEQQAHRLGGRWSVTKGDYTVVFAGLFDQDAMA